MLKTAANLSRASFTKQLAALISSRGLHTTKILNAANTQSVPNDDLPPLEQKLLRVLELNREGDVTKATEAYEELHAEHVNELHLRHYNNIISSFAPRRLMLKWFKPYKDFVDMYHEAGKYRATERIDEAKLVFNDLLESPLNLKPDIVTYNSLIKVQLSCGDDEVERVFKTFDALQDARLRPNIATFASLLRACAILEQEESAEKIYAHVMTHHHCYDYEPIGTHFYNTMLDVYAETRSVNAHVFFDILLNKRIPLDGNTFNTYAKACIFRDERTRLVAMTELMRVHGVLQRELSGPVRQEILEAYQKYVLDAEKPERKKPVPLISDPRVRDYFEELRGLPVWGRNNDVLEYRRDEILQKLTDETVYSERFPKGPHNPPQ